MRLVPFGPDFPNELLEERDAGNVVFFCGAGISRPAGLPGFVRPWLKPWNAEHAAGRITRALRANGQAYKDMACAMLRMRRWSS